LHEYDQKINIYKFFNMNILRVSFESDTINNRPLKEIFHG
jgi:hypothetical protein